MIAVTQRVLDRFLAIGLYTCIAVGVVWFGSRLINYVLDARFYHEYLTGWELALMQFRQQGGVYPEFNGGNHYSYMQDLVTTMNLKMSSPPASNTEDSFVYVIDKVGRRPHKIFLLVLKDRMVMYNLPYDSVHRLDRFIDGQENLEQGWFTGQLSKDQSTYIGSWKL